MHRKLKEIAASVSVPDALLVEPDLAFPETVSKYILEPSGVNKNRSVKLTSHLIFCDFLCLEVLGEFSELLSSRYQESNSFETAILKWQQFLQIAADVPAGGTESIFSQCIVLIAGKS